jgi:uncharacterized membrane protein
MGISCTDGSTIQSGSICRNVTTIGTDSNDNLIWIFLIVIALIYALAIKVQSPYVLFFASILTLLFGLFIVKFGINTFKDTQITWSIGLLIWAVGIFTMYVSVEEQLKSWG